MTPAEQALDRVRTGARIGQLRHAHNMTAAAVAARLGCSESHIYNIESGRSRASDKHRHDLAQLFDAPDLEAAS